MNSDKDYINEKTKVILENEEIEWSSGTDKSYGETVFEWWSKELGNSPTKRDLRRLKNQRNKFKTSICSLKDEYKELQGDQFAGEESELNLLHLIELYEDAYQHLTSYWNTIQLIEQIAHRRSNSGKSGYSFEEIRTGLYTYFRNQSETNKTIIKKANVNVPPSTFSTWKGELDKKLE